MKKVFYKISSTLVVIGLVILLYFLADICKILK